MTRDITSTATTGWIDPGRALLRMDGADVRAVLQGVVTNDVDGIGPERAVYAALLTPQGKYLFDFFLLDAAPFGAPAGAVLIDIAADRADALAARLKMYCLRRDAAVVGRAELSVQLLWGDGAAEAAADANGVAVPDPRHAGLGLRLYAPIAAPLADGVAPADRGAYDALRVQHLIPATGAELVADETFILEAGFERLAGVDFRKGCYVGQEVTARMKHKTELRKGLVRVSVTGGAPSGTPIIAAGKPAGTLYTSADGQGLAHLRHDRAAPDMVAGDATVNLISE